MHQTIRIHKKSIIHIANSQKPIFCRSDGRQTAAGEYTITISKTREKKRDYLFGFASINTTQLGVCSKLWRAVHVPNSHHKNHEEIWAHFGEKRNQKKKFLIKNSQTKKNICLLFLMDDTRTHKLQHTPMHECKWGFRILLQKWSLLLLKFLPFLLLLLFVCVFLLVLRAISLMRGDGYRPCVCACGICSLVISNLYVCTLFFSSFSFHLLCAQCPCECYRFQRDSTANHFLRCARARSLMLVTRMCVWWLLAYNGWRYSYIRTIRTRPVMRNGPSSSSLEHSDDSDFNLFMRLNFRTMFLSSTVIVRRIFLELFYLSIRLMAILSASKWIVLCAFFISESIPKCDMQPTVS